MASDSQAQTGSAADRERYITERADQLARIYEPLLASHRRALDRDPVRAAFRDLIDRGVLK